LKNLIDEGVVVVGEGQASKFYRFFETPVLKFSLSSPQQSIFPKKINRKISRWKNPPLVWIIASGVHHNLKKIYGDIYEKSFIEKEIDSIPWKYGVNDKKRANKFLLSFF
ncbi:MAG: hypothetical protein QXT71_05225, partial [Thermoplasmata archaeon]